MTPTCPTTLACRLKQFFTGKSFLTFIASVAVIAAVAFAYFYPDAAEGNVLRQHDMQQGTAIGQEAKAFAEATGESSRWTNSLFSGMPTFQIAPDYPSNRWFSWINTVMGLGLPSPANLLAMMMLGMLILLLVMKLRWWVALIGAIAYGLSSYFVIIIAAGHLWKFATLAYIPPTIAGVILAYRGRYLAGAAMAGLFAMMQIAANHVQMTYYFLPVVAGFMLIALLTALKERQGAMRRWWIATGALAVAAVAAVGANSPSLYNTYEYSKETMRGGHSELSRDTSADAALTTAGLDRDYITQYSYAPSETFSLLIPNIKGGATNKPEKGSTKMLTLGDLPEAKAMVREGKIDSTSAGFLEYVTQYFGDPEGTNGPVYVGALIVALFLLGCVIVKGPVKWVLLALTVLSIGLAWGRHMMWLTNLFIDWVPMYSKFRTVESILVVAEFTMPLLAMLALQRIFTAPDNAGAYRKPILWSFGIVLAFCLIGIIAPGFYGSAVSDNDRMVSEMITRQIVEQGYDSSLAAQFSIDNPAIYSAVTTVRESMVEADSMRSFMFVAAGFCLLVLYMRRKLNVAVAAVITGVLICGDLFMVNKRYLDHDSFVPRSLSAGDPIAMTDADREILRDTTMNYRVMDMQRFQQADPSYYHKMIGGYHAAKLTRYQDLIDCHLSHILTGEITEADMNVLNMLNARYIVNYDGRPLFNDEAFGNAWLVDKVKYVKDADNEMAGLSAINLRDEAVADGKFHSILGESSPKQPGDTIFETSYAPNRLTYHVESANGGVAVFSEVYFPWGWHVTVDGTPAELGRVNYLLRAMKIPAGSHTVEMWFDPQSLHTTGTIARICILLIFAAVLAAVAQAFSSCPSVNKEPEAANA